MRSHEQHGRVTAPLTLTAAAQPRARRCPLNRRPPLRPARPGPASFRAQSRPGGAARPSAGAEGGTEGGPEQRRGRQGPRRQQRSGSAPPPGAAGERRGVRGRRGRPGSGTGGGGRVPPVMGCAGGRGSVSAPPRGFTPAPLPPEGSLGPAGRHRSG